MRRWNQDSNPCLSDSGPDTIMLFTTPPFMFLPLCAYLFLEHFLWSLPGKPSPFAADVIDVSLPPLVRFMPARLPAAGTCNFFAWEFLEVVGTCSAHTLNRPAVPGNWCPRRNSRPTMKEVHHPFAFLSLEWFFSATPRRIKLHLLTIVSLLDNSFLIIPFCLTWSLLYWYFLIIT